MSDHETLLKLMRLKIAVENAMESLKSGAIKPMNHIEKMEHEIRYGRDAIVLQEFVITKR